MLIGADLFCLFLLFVSINFMVRKLYLRFLLLCSNMQSILKYLCRAKIFLVFLFFLTCYAAVITTRNLFFFC